MITFKIGERVKRIVWFSEEKIELKKGVVINCYSETKKGGYYPELYKVKWDNGVIEKGFLPHGLRKENYSNNKSNG